MSGLDPRGTHNTDSDGCPNGVGLVRTTGSEKGIEAGIRLGVDKHTGEP